MTLSTATKIAIAGVAIAFAMSIASQYWINWVTSSNSLTREQFAVWSRAYFHLQSLCNYGGLLTFLVTLKSKQRGPAQP